MERSQLRARLGALSHHQSESHLKAGTGVATQLAVKKRKTQLTQLLVLKGKRDTEESLIVAREKLKYRGYQVGGRSLQRSQVCEQQHLET
jgi:hypothetical protein